MNEQDRQIVEVAKQYGDDLFMDLVAIIERLDKQLAEIKKAGEPFEKFVACCKETDSDAWIMCSTSGHKVDAHLRLYDFRRLAQAMKEVKDDN